MGCLSAAVEGGAEVMRELLLMHPLSTEGNDGEMNSGDGDGCKATARLDSITRLPNAPSAPTTRLCLVSGSLPTRPDVRLM